MNLAARHSRVAPKHSSLCGDDVCILHWYILGDHSRNKLTVPPRTRQHPRIKITEG